jgi:hypothetical protein
MNCKFAWCPGNNRFNPRTYWGKKEPNASGPCVLIHSGTQEFHDDACNSATNAFCVVRKIVKFCDTRTFL